MIRFGELIKRLRSREHLSQEILGRRLGNISQKTIFDWEHGSTPRARYLKRVADYLGKSVDDLMAYNSGETDQSIDDFLDGASANPREERFALIMDWLPKLQMTEVSEIARKCFDLIFNGFSFAAQKSLPISGMVKLQDTSNSDIPDDRIQAIKDDDRPSDLELVQLSLVLSKPDGRRWTTHELMEIRDRDFPPSNCEFKERIQNGSGI